MPLRLHNRKQAPLAHGSMWEGGRARVLEHGKLVDGRVRVLEHGKLVGDMAQALDGK